MFDFALELNGTSVMEPKIRVFWKMSIYRWLKSMVWKLFFCELGLKPFVYMGSVETYEPVVCTKNDKCC